MPVGVYSVYGSLGSKLAWRLDENFLHNESHDYKVKVLAEELAYNKSLKQFKMFIIDRPLDPSYKLKASVWCVFYTASGASTKKEHNNFRCTKSTFWL